ncbi:MAG: SHOCT domain-containing protein [Firmicutes bacterium]|jgi:putative membrane protein|nr:SHOCT domain-containing protein [Bacillota bacterium]
MMGFGVSGGLAGMWIMGLLGLLILVGVIVLIVWAIRALIPANRSGAPAAAVDPLTQLQLRLARGDITPDEYEELRAHLRD